MAGTITAQTGEKLERELEDIFEKSKYKVFYDHGNGKEGKIQSHFDENNKLSATYLSAVDIMITKGNEIMYLIEIEEGTASPKKLIGDAMAALLGDYIRLTSGTQYNVINKTELLIYSLASEKGHKSEQVKYIEKKVEELKSKCKTKNAQLKKVRFRLCYEKELLKDKVINDIKKGLQT